ncbi:MAG: DNA translocase FtsK 4TM domain-containing protein [Desulfamplus sp.]|nr:DNA translocase FtsK 4TM domain-containing protein [Desulfamplus sp.]
MKKELIAILILFFVVLTSLSLLSYSPLDPSINHQSFSSENIHNIFGIVGSHLSGILVDLFGVAALWFPLSMFLASLSYLRGKNFREIVIPTTGSIIIMLSTSGILPIIKESVFIRGGMVTSGGFTGLAISRFLLEYTNIYGAVIILIFFIFAGVVIATGISAYSLFLITRDFILIVLKSIGLKTLQTHTLAMHIFQKVKANDALKSENLSTLTKMFLNRVDISKLINFRLDLKAISFKKNLSDVDFVTKTLTQTTTAPNNTPPKQPKTKKSTFSTQQPDLKCYQESTQQPDLKDYQESAQQPDLKDYQESAQQPDLEDYQESAQQPNLKDYQKSTQQFKFNNSSEDNTYFSTKNGDFILPPLSLLNQRTKHNDITDMALLKQKGEIVENKLKDFGVKGEIVDILPGPVITTFEYRPAAGVKISKIVNLTDDLALALSALSIRIVAPIPGKDVVGIEIPNDKREMVVLKELLSSNEFLNSESRLTLALGRDIVGNPVSTIMDSMPHLLIAGATGTGKSVGLNSMIISLLYKAKPDEVKFIMVDPKRIELSVYDDIPHLISPVVTDMKKATNALFWAVKEMDRRYELLAQNGVRNLLQYNKMVEQKANSSVVDSNCDNVNNSTNIDKLPYIVVIVDEFADLMMVASRDVESALIRLAQMARAAGIHLILATQRPSVDVLTGIIKANFPTRVSFQVSSKIDSRTILDTNGAERLLGNGDMLFLPPGTGRLQRIQGAYISEEEISRVTSFLKKQQKPRYVEEITEKLDGDDDTENSAEDLYDEKYDEALALVLKTRQASISSVQRHLRIGYNRAARIIETMEKEGVVGPQDGSKPREILIKSYDSPK